MLKGSAERITEGKTKIVWSSGINPNNVLIRNKNSITAGDGLKKHTIDKKGIYSTETTCNCFYLLNKRKRPNHFVSKIEQDTFRARRLKMIPIEVVVRRIAYGSYLKRHPYVSPKMVFHGLVAEFFYKDDRSHDPLLVFDRDADVRKRWKLYDAKKPFIGADEAGFLPENCFKFKILRATRTVDEDVVYYMKKIAQRSFLDLEEVWASQNVALVDLKMEFGFDFETGKLMVGDVIDNDSWRIWPEGDESKMRDKEKYRKIENPTPEDLEKIRQDYEWVAEASKKFVI